MGRTSDARSRLIESAGELIHERGFNAVGVSEICAHAGVNKGSFYHFFSSKQQLVLDVVGAIWESHRRLMEETLLGDGPPLDRLRLFFDRLYDRYQKTCDGEGRQVGCPLANLALEMSTQDPLIRVRVLQTFEGQIGYLESLLREASRRGDLAHDLDPRGGAEMIVALMEGKIMLSKLRDDPETLRDLGSLVLQALAAPAHGTS
jgi:TetR/AcrR family transcriptional regulator, transcriptional repressor for nem operon